MGTHPIFESDFDCLTDLQSANNETMGITRDSEHKKRATGGVRPMTRKKRAFQLGRPSSMTKLAAHRVHHVRTRGGNMKYRALRLDQGNFSWATEAVSRKTRLIDVVYNASNNEMVRTKTLVKGCIVTIDSTPFRQWYEAHYAKGLGRKKNAKLTEEENKVINGEKSASVQKKIDARAKNADVATALSEQFGQGRLLARISSRPGQQGRCDGYILEGKELDFYVRKLKATTKKSKTETSELSSPNSYLTLLPKTLKRGSAQSIQFTIATSARSRSSKSQKSTFPDLWSSTVKLASRPTLKERL